MKFSKCKFLKQADKFTKRQYSKYLDEMDGKEIDFTRGKYGTAYLEGGYFIYPVYREWCE